jgi:kinesin family protein 3/17
MSKSESIKVVVRCRPLNSREKEDGRQKIVDMDKKNCQVVLNNPKGDTSGEPPKQFTFDAVMDELISQKEVYELSARPIVSNVIEGYNGTVFAYGQVLFKMIPSIKSDSHSEIGPYKC